MALPPRCGDLEISEGSQDHKFGGGGLYCGSAIFSVSAAAPDGGVGYRGHWILLRHNFSCSLGGTSVVTLVLGDGVATVLVSPAAWATLL